MSGEGIYLYNLALLIPYILADSGTYHDGTYKCGNTAYHVDGTGACKIMEADL